MIRWQEAPAAALARPLHDLYAGLAAIDVVALEARIGDGAVLLVSAEAQASAARHVGGRRTEQGGLLVGTPYACDPEGGRVDVVRVRAAVGAVDFSSSGVSLRMETGVWDRARAALAPGEVVVGWFHSHPRLGAFFSDTDRRTQAAFFNHPFSVGWVIDPFANEDAWFLGADAEAIAPARILGQGRAPARESDQ
jgi:hypothetical protein